MNKKWTAIFEKKKFMETYLLAFDNSGGHDLFFRRQHSR